MTAVRSGLVEVCLILMTEEGSSQLSHRLIKTQLQVIISSKQSFENLNYKSHECQKLFFGLWEFLYLEPDKREFVIIQSKYSQR